MWFLKIFLQKLFTFHIASMRATFPTHLSDLLPSYLSKRTNYDAPHYAMLPSQVFGHVQACASLVE